MVETITPVVHGGRRGRWAGDVALHVAGATLSAAAFGAVLGAAGSVLGAPWGRGGLLVVVAVSGTYLLREAGAVPVPVPQLRRQVPEWWRTFFTTPVASFLYGVGLGVGFLTFLRQGTLVAVAVAAASSGRPGVGALLVAPFGIARGLSVLATARIRAPEEGQALVGRLEAAASAPAWRTAHVVALAAITATAAWAMVGSAADVQVGAVAAGVVGAVFAWSAGGKLLRPTDWRRARSALGLRGPLDRVAAIGAPVAEAAVLGLVVAGLHRTAGIAGLALLLVFSLAVLRARRRGGDLVPCGCFGTVKARDYRVLLLRNAVLAVVAAVAATWGIDTPRLGSPGIPTGPDVLPLAFAVVGLSVAAWTVTRSVRSLGRRGAA
ncbi:MAG TPA: MauE/DoxX family redox-associated membrane protein [Actinomycetota bacterium]